MNNKREAILSFPLDAPNTGLKFSDRLAQENQWSSEFTLRVITEYRRFLILCAELDHPVTPPDAVDQVWHLHLCYTESYWNDLCRDTLESPLHHGPTKGGQEERAKFHDWYKKTIEAYEEVFHEAPPRDIWLNNEERFGHNFKRVDLNSHFVISRPRLIAGALGTVVTLGLASCSTLLSEGSSFPGGIFIFFIIIALIIIIFRKGGGSGKGGSGGAGCAGGSSGSSGGWFGGFLGGSDGDSGGSGCSSGCGGGGGCGSGCGS